MIKAMGNCIHDRILPIPPQGSIYLILMTICRRYPETCHYIEQSFKVQRTYVQTKTVIRALETSNSDCAQRIYVSMRH
jgi:hypothetical protein